MVTGNDTRQMHCMYLCWCRWDEIMATIDVDVDSGATVPGPTPDCVGATAMAPRTQPNASGIDNTDGRRRWTCHAAHRQALAHACHASVMGLVRAIINTRTSDVAAKGRCSYDLWCRAVQCLAWGAVLLCTELNHSTADVVQYFPLANWHLEHHKQKRQLPIKVLGILVSVDTVSERLRRNGDVGVEEIVNLWLLAMFESAVLDADLDKLVPFVFRAVGALGDVQTLTPHAILATLRSSASDEGGATRTGGAVAEHGADTGATSSVDGIDYQYRLRVLDYFSEQISIQPTGSVNPATIVRNLHKVMQRNRDGLTGLQWTEYARFSSRAAALLLARFSPRIYTPGAACMFPRLVTEYVVVGLC